MINLKRSLLLVLTVGALSGCISGTKPPDVYTSPSTGQTTLIESDKEMCVRSCNDDYSRCMEAAPVEQETPAGGTPNGMFGASADCRTDLKNCLPQCKSR